MEQTTSINIGTFVLEDDIDIHDIIQSMLREKGFTKIHIHDTPEAFLAELDADINLCVIDHKLNSGLTGFDVLKKVKEKNKWSYVIVMTGQLDKKVVIDYLNAGADKYVDKGAHISIGGYMEELIDKLITGIDVARERIKLVKLLEATKQKL